jgi:hypothetical protein
LHRASGSKDSVPCSKSTLQRIRQRCSNAETDALCRVLAVEPVVPCPEVVVARFGSAMGRFLSPGRRPEQNGGWRRSHYPPELRLAPSIDRVRRMVHRQVWRDSTGLVSLPFGKPRPSDPTLPVTTLKTAWNSVRKNAKVTGRFHDNRHTLITELAESGAGDQTIMDIAGHVSKQMLKHYSHIRMEAKADSSRIHCQETDGQSLFRSTNRPGGGVPAKVPTWVRERSHTANEQPQHGAACELCQSKKNATAMLRITRKYAAF